MSPWFPLRQPQPPRSPARYVGGHRVGLLRGGLALFPEQNEAIAQAQHEVWLATYIFHNDEAGAQTVAALRHAAGRGVRVRVVVDGFGSKASLAWLREQLQGSGVELAVFRPMDRWWRWLQPGQLRRLHQKLCVVDAELGFVGGINLIDDHIDLHHGRSPQPRLDFAVRVQGSIVAEIAQCARAVWTRAWLGRDAREELGALLRSASPVARAQRLLAYARMPGQANVPSTDLPQDPVFAAFVLRDNFRRRRAIERLYVHAIEQAQHRVDLISPYFYPGQRIRQALINAARRGVRVRLLLQGKVDYRIAALAAQALYEELLGQGVQIYEYTPAFLHAKVCAVDGCWATVGSSNIDPLSLLLNLEANVAVDDADFAQQVHREFDMAQSQSRRIEQAPTRGLRGAGRRALVAWAAYVYLRVAGATGRY
ncbi:cardiolipin synthase ClsB [Roseateles sp. BYS180W]|uniref:Cardiolipin synthase B n=1 Tax=Roseateles rivi TaxID=3299028 RepID=A0ABW7FVA4_9BURK